MNSPVNTPGPTPTTVVVFPPDRSSIGVLVVAPPYPVGHKPQPDSSLGININMVHGDRDGLLIYLLAYLNMTVGDFIRVFIATKNVPVVEFPITDAHFDSNGIAKDIPFHIPADDMHDKFAPLLSEKKDIWVEVRRISDNSTEDSPHALLFYKHPAPGEPDTDGGKPFNQGLRLPDASESLIDQTVIDDGMFVTIGEYFNQQIGDTVVLAFGSLLLEIEVTALGDVLFELSPEMLATLKPTNTIIVRWEVFDVVENSSGWSDALVIVFKPGIVLLTPPIFEQADIDNVVHHDWLAGASMSILITGVFAIGDVVVLLLEGVTEGGDTVSHSDSIPVATATRSLSVDVDNYRVQNVIRGSLRATYTQNRAGEIQQSKPADATVAGGAFKLSQPTITPLENNNTVPVDTVEVTVQFPKYWPLKPGAIVELLWQTVDDEGIPVLIILQQIVSDSTQLIIFKIPAKYIGPFPGSELTVQCAVTNPGEVRVVSEPLPLKISDEKAIVLGPPTLVGAPAPIDPLAGARTMRVEFAAKITGDQARLVHVKAPVGSAPFALEVLNQNNRANWLLDNIFLVANNGKTVRFRWNLRRKSQKVASSRDVDLEIMPIAPADARLPMVKISGVEGVVDVQKLTAANRLVADAWIGQHEGQARHLQLIGTANNGKDTIYDVLKGEPTGGEIGLDAPAPIPWFKTLKDGSRVRLVLFVNVDGTSDVKTALRFPENSYLVDTLDEKQPVITKVLDAQGREIPQNSETITSTVTAHVNGTPDQRIKILLNGALQTTVTTDKAGNASATVSAGNFDAYNHLIAQADYGQNLSSPARSWILRKALQIDTTRRLLNGIRVYAGWRETGARWPGNWLQLSPLYGVGQRRFSSSNPGVVSVDASGVITGLRWGAAWIYVQDSFTTLSIYVDSINIYTLDIYRAYMTFNNAVNWMNGVSGSIPVTQALSSMRVVYGNDRGWPLLPGWDSWQCESCGPGLALRYSWAQAGLICASSNVSAWPWCLRRY